MAFRADAAGGNGSRSRAVLFVQYTAEMTGSPISGHMIVAALLADGWNVEAVFSDSGPCHELYAKAGCSIHRLPHGTWLLGGTTFRRCRRWYPEFRAFLGFRRLIAQCRPQLVYVNNVTGVAAVAAARTLGVPCVWHIRELFQDVGGEMRSPFPGGRWLVRRLVRDLPDRIVSVSEAVHRSVVGAWKSAKACVVPNAVFQDFFANHRTREEARNRLGLPCGIPLVGVPGTLRPVKGHPFFLQAAGQVAEQIPDCHFALTGDGPAAYRAELEQQVEQTNLGTRTHFLGTVVDMPGFYRACDVVCVPSRSESFGRTVIEAFAAGVPVVGTAVGGMRETIEHEETGLLVPYGDVDILAETLTRLLSDGRVRSRLAEQAQAKAEQCYGERSYQVRINQIVGDLVDRP